MDTVFTKAPAAWCSCSLIFLGGSRHAFFWGGGFQRPLQESLVATQQIQSTFYPVAKPLAEQQFLLCGGG